MASVTNEVKQLRHDYIEHAYKAAKLENVEVPPPGIFLRDTRNPTFRIYHGIATSVNQGRAWADPAWLDPMLGFERFVVDLGPRPEGCGLDRIDINEPWSITNAQWVEKIRYERPQPPRAVVEIRRQKKEKLAKDHRLNMKDLERRAGYWLYQTWTALLGRCNDILSKGYGNYGGRGIEVCIDWDDGCTWGFESFAAYVLSTLGPRPKGMTLDRIDNDRGYEPGNLRWATAKEQIANRRTSEARLVNLQAAREAQAKAAQEPGPTHEISAINAQSVVSGERAGRQPRRMYSRLAT